MVAQSRPIRIGQFEYDIILERGPGSAPVYRQIADALRERIVSGQIATGTRLPPERRLAAQLGVNRSTIVTAYDELVSANLVNGRVGDGTVVTFQAEQRGAGSGRSIPWHQLFANGSADLSPWIREILRIALRSDVIPFAASEPSPDLFPMEEVEAIAHGVLRDAGGDCLRYSPTEGIQPLREAIAERMRRRGARVSAANVIITAGAQQALDLLGRCFLDPGSEAAVESPTFVGAIQAFRNRAARVVGVPVDEHGLRIEAVDDLLHRRRVKLLFVTPNFSNPTGAVLSEERRSRLVEITRRHQVPVIEDNVYGDTWLDSPPPASLIERPGSEHVIHVGSLSKALFAGLRIGWVVAQAPVVERMALHKQVADLFSGSFAQWLALGIFQSGLYDRHIERVRTVYRERRDQLIAALLREGRGAIVPNRPTGGSFLWCHLNDGLGSRDLLTQAAVQGVTFVPGDVFSVEGEEQSSLRLGFSLLNRQGIEEGARRLSSAINALRQRRKEETQAIAQPLV
ncbi:MAG TPA: PLP-dependent aminotransferase family protein [Dehalococcoidia bacterium]|nr:PLP-dependent aminotransferase family protein [Dehalococcoidia bacterium]